ncbi:MAG: molybdopterin molybdotransferase MoeA, partial [Flavobacteriaceae bacterium]
MYEDIQIENEIAHIIKQPQRGHNIHIKGSDEKKGALILKEGKIITAAEAGVLATVGKVEILVKKLPIITVISTGNELVDININPLPHQIRRSNSYSLKASLLAAGINPTLQHLPDDRDKIRVELAKAIEKSDVLLLSGGVSKGKFDFIPQVMAELGVKKVFHGVRQRPGKPFWFGIHDTQRTWIFSFPGNPVSTFVNYHVYFKNWLNKSLDITVPQLSVFLREEIAIKGSLTRFIGVETGWEKSCLIATQIQGNGSGDLISLAKTDGFIKLEPREEPYKQMELVPFIPCRSIL